VMVAASGYHTARLAFQSVCEPCESVSVRPPCHEVASVLRSS
jgi:hypothetical protein